MNAKTEKRLGLLAAFLLTTAIFIAPNSIAKRQQTGPIITGQSAAPASQPMLLAQNTMPAGAIR